MINKTLYFMAWIMKIKKIQNSYINLIINLFLIKKDRANSLNLAKHNKGF